MNKLYSKAQITEGVQVRCLSARNDQSLTIGKVYEVVDVEDTYFMIEDDDGDDWEIRFLDNENRFEIFTKSILNLEEGDLVVDEDSDFRMVLAVLPKMFAYSEVVGNNRVLSAEFSAEAMTFEDWITYDLAKENGWKYYPIKDEEQIEELTMDEVCKRLGKKVKIVKDKA